MRRSDDAEARAAGGDEATAAEEILEVGGRRHVPRWLPAAAVAAAGILVASVAVAHGGSHARQKASESSSDGSPLPNVALPVPPVDPPLQVGKGAVLDAVAFGQHVWVLHPDRITGLSIAAGRDRSVALPRRGPSAVNGSWRLVLDPATARLWVVLEGTRHGRAVEYNLWTLTRVRVLRLPPINGAAAMDGRLYLTSDRQLIVVPPRAAARAVPVRAETGATTLGPVVADPARSRVLVLDYSAPTHIWIYRPHTNQLRMAAVLPLTKASLAVTDQAVWVGGFTRTSAALWKVDIPSLTLTGMSPLSGDLGPGAVLLAGGKHDLWVASGGGPGLWCVNDQSGTAEQHWTLTPTAVTTDEQQVIAVTDGHAVPLHPHGGCTG
jgi:hypothetical protein